MAEIAELRQQIEELALRLVMAGPEEQEACAASWAGTLEDLREKASRLRAGQLGSTVTALLQELGGGAAPDLQSGIARLQEALEGEQQPAATPHPSTDLMPAQDPELLGDFVLESREHLANIENQVLTLERDPHGDEALNAVFRGFHTIKGLAGFLELWEVQKLAHEVETVLDRARNGQITITPPAIDVILESSDALRRWLSHVEADLRGEPSQPPAHDESLFERVRAAAISAADSPTEAQPQSAPDATPAKPPAVSPGPRTDAVAAPPATPEAPPPAEPGLARMAQAVQSAASEEARPQGPPAPDGAGKEAMAVRVDTAKLDYLVDMAGEMVIAQSLVRHDPELGAVTSPRLQRNMAQLARITAELQKTAMSMRLVPIGPLFRKMARLVRDLSRQFGKKIELETQGDEIELDRRIVEELADPFMHMVRNALDHGIEGPEEREMAGKAPVARLLLKGYHQAGQVVIEITDDGRGLDREKIIAKGIQRGLISSGEGLSDSEAYNLIFQPGFSTAAKVTNVSGRGVGMDVVRRHVEKLRGRVEIRSQKGAGSTFLLKLPLTLAIIDGLVVGVGEERYIAPLFAVRELLRPNAETIWTVQQKAEMALIRKELLPVLRLYKRFNVTPRSEDPLNSVLVVAEVEGQRFCLLVDELIGKQEVVIKSLGETFKDVQGVAGGAILGDGRVGLILDLERLFKDRNDDAGR